MPSFPFCYNGFRLSGRTLVSILKATQKFAEPILKDVVDFATRLRGAGVTQSFASQLDVLIAAATATDFRLKARSYSSSTDVDVSKATGLHFVFPSGEDKDRFNVSGRKSIAHYKTVAPTSTWASFVEVWNLALTAKATVDLGAGSNLELYEVWDTATVRVGADVDYYLVEPDGTMWSPWKGRRTSNGYFSGDSWDFTPHSYYEAWVSDRVVEVGKYRIYAHQYGAPAGHTTYLDVAYRFNSSQNFTYLYRDTPAGPVVLNQSRRIEDDPSWTLDKVASGAYSNFKLVASWQPGASQSAMPSLVAPILEGFSGEAVSPLDPAPTDLPRLIRGRRATGAQSSESRTPPIPPVARPPLPLRR